MPTHAETEAAFAQGIRQGALPEGLTARAAGEVERRFAVYRNNVATGLIRALGRRFPVIERLVGADFAAAMFGEFGLRHPPESPVLLAYGEAMPGFLATFSPVAHLP